MPLAKTRRKMNRNVRKKPYSHICGLVENKATNSIKASETSEKLPAFVRRNAHAQGV